MFQQQQRRRPQVSSFGSTSIQCFLLYVLMTAWMVHAGTNEAGLAFLESNKVQPNVITLPSGLQYKVLKRGRGTAHPTIDSSCSCHYEGKLLDGTVFDSSYDRGQPTTFAPNQVIRGWTEAMQLMVTGDKWELYIPSELAYGDRGSPPKIGGGEVLIFQMEILAILGDSVPAITCQVDDSMTDCNEREQGYITKMKDKAQENLIKEWNRIKTVLEKPMSDDLRDWARRRANILDLLIHKNKVDTTEEL